MSNPNSQGVQKQQWWLSKQGKPVGPHDEAFVQAGLRTGKIPPQTYACMVGGQEWKRLCELPAFAQSCPPEAVTPRRSEAPPVIATVVDETREKRQPPYSTRTAGHEPAPLKRYWPFLAAVAALALAIVGAISDLGVLAGIGVWVFAIALVYGLIRVFRQIPGSAAIRSDDPEEERRQIRRDRKVFNTTSLSTGIAAVFLFVLAGLLAVPWNAIVSFVALVLFCIAGAFFAKYKGHHPAWGLLSALSLLPLVLLPDRKRQRLQELDGILAVR